MSAASRNEPPAKCGTFRAGPCYMWSKVCNLNPMDSAPTPTAVLDSTTSPLRRSAVRRSAAWFVAFAIAVVCGSAAVPGDAGAATYVVDSPLDTPIGACASLVGPADCTLRDAITQANVTSGPDTIQFEPALTPLAVQIDSPLPPAQYPLAINASGLIVTVNGTAAYSAGYCAAPGFPYALDLTDPAAAGSTVAGLPMYDVCGRAIESNATAPTISVGPRRHDGTLPINGAAPAATSVDVFYADGPSTADREADEFLYALAVSQGFYAYAPPVELVPGRKLTATATGVAGTSDFASRATVPDDIVSPSLLRAVAVSNSRVRVDFDESVDPASVAPPEFALAIGNAVRPISAATPAGTSVFLDSAGSWETGEAGHLSFNGVNRVTDAVGNQLLGQPAVTVYAGPGELDPPAITAYRFQRSRVCRKVSKKCRRKSIFLSIQVSKPVRARFEVIRGARTRKTIARFARDLKTGRNLVRLTSTVSGRRLPAATFSLRAVVQDVARTTSDPAEAAFRVVTSKRDL